MKPLLLALVLFAGCHLFDGGRVSKLEYPCGASAHACPRSQGCCENTEVCGAENTSCPAGACCYVGGDTWSTP